MKNKLAYFITKCSMFSIGYFLIFKDNGKNAWISIILGTILGIIIIYFYTLIKKVLKGETLLDKLKKSKLGIIYILLFIIFYLLLIIIILLVLSIFVNSFYLLHTPKLMVIIPFIILSLLLAYKEDYIFTNLSNFLFWGSILIVIIFSFLLTPYFKYDELLPFLNYKISNILTASLIYASLTSIPQILIIDFYADGKSIMKDYLIGSFFNFLITLGTILGAGNNLIKVYSFPEYDVLKQIKILDFIENIENISALGWYSELFMVLTILTNNLKKALPKKHNKIYISLLILIITYITSFIIGGNYIKTFQLFYYYPYILIIFFLIFITLYFYLRKIKNAN